MQTWFVWLLLEWTLTVSIFCICIHTQGIIALALEIKCACTLKRQPRVLHLWVPGAEVGCGLWCGLFCLCCKWHAHCCVMLVAAEVLVESLGSSHLFSSLLPLSLAYVGPVAAQDPRVIMIVFNASLLRVCSPLGDALQLAAQDPRVIMIVFSASHLRVCSPLGDALQLF